MREEEHIEFIGFLVNCDSSVSKVKLRHGFKFERKSVSEIEKLVVSFENAANSEFGLRKFLNRVRSLTGTESLVVITNTFHSWGNEDSYFIGYDPYGPDRDDGFLVADYLEPVIRLMKLFKEGDLAMPLSISYEVREGTPFPSHYGGDRHRTLGGTKYSLDDSEVPELQELLDTTGLPFKRGFVQLAFDFFELSCTLRIPSLIFLVLMIGLEVLFKPGDRGGTTRKISSNVSKLLGDDGEDRERVYSEIWKLYEKRCIIVHQGVYDYGSYLSRIAPNFEKASIEYPMGKDDPRFVHTGDILQLRNYMRSSIMKILRVNEDKEKFLRHLDMP